MKDCTFSLWSYTSLIVFAWKLFNSVGYPYNTVDNSAYIFYFISRQEYFTWIVGIFWKSQIKVPLKFVDLQPDLSLLGIISQVGVVNFAGINVLFRKQTLLDIFKSSDFFWVKENAADRADFENLCCPLVCPIACQLLYLFLDGLVICIVSGVSPLM